MSVPIFYIMMAIRSFFEYKLYVNDFKRDLQYFKFCAYGFLKNQRFFEPFMVLFFLEKGLSFFQIGLLVTTREFVQNLLEIPSGIMSDSIGRRKTMIGAFTLYIAAFMIFYFSQDYRFFFVAMACYATGDAFRSGTHKAMIYEYLRIKGWQKYKVDYYGHTRSWSQFGSAVSSLLAVVIVFFSGNYSTIFIVAVVPYVLDLILMISYPRELDSTGYSDSCENSSIRLISTAKISIGTMRNSVTRKAMVNSVLYSSPFKITKDYYQPVLAALAAGIAVHLHSCREEQISAVLIGIMYFALYIGTAWASRNAKRLSERYSNLALFLNRSLLTGLMFFFAVGAVFVLPYPWRWVVILPFTAIYFMENLRRPVGVAYISETFAPGVMATILSVESQFRSLGAALLAPIFGLLADKFGIASAFMLLAVILVLLYPLAKLGNKY